jgi:hypothetical protein
MVIDRLFCTHWRCASKKHICAKIIETKKFSVLKFPGDFVRSRLPILDALRSWGEFQYCHYRAAARSRCWRGDGVY